MQLEKLLSDYKALEKNEFWKFFWNRVNLNMASLLDSLGTGTSLSESKMREKQGIYIACRDMFHLPHKLAEDIQKKIEDNSDDKEPQKE